MVRSFVTAWFRRILLEEICKFTVRMRNDLGNLDECIAGVQVSHNGWL